MNNLDYTTFIFIKDIHQYIKGDIVELPITKDEFVNMNELHDYIEIYEVE